MANRDPVRACGAGSFKHACATPGRARVMQCMVLIDTGVARRSATSIRRHATPSG
jgi:hypothetical protein